MAFDNVYHALQEVFPHVDNRILRAVAVEHSDDLNTALDYILSEALPYVSTKSISSVTPQENQHTIGKTDERAVREQQRMMMQHHVAVESTDVGSSSTSGSHFFRNANHIDHSSVQQEVQNEYDWSAVRNLNTVTSQKSYEETSLDGAPVDVQHSLAQLVLTSDNHEADQDTLACAQKEDSYFDNMPLEVALSVVERALCSDQEDSPDQDALGYSIKSLNDYGVVAHCEKPEATYSVDLNASQANSVSEMLDDDDDDDESMLNTTLTRSQVICSVDFLEDIIEYAKNNKSTLFDAMDPVITTMREVEQKEKEAEEAKEEAARAGEEILSKSEDLKKMLQQSKDVNDKHAGEIYGEKGILATEARELQSRLLCLSDERDKSLAILNELNASLQARLALSEEEIAAAEMDKLRKEQAAEERHTEQKIIMEKVVEESKKLQQEAEENSKLREFLVDRGRVVDTLQGEISVICQDVKLLKEKYDARVPLSKSVSSSQTTCRLASSTSSLKSVASVHALEQFQFTESPKKAPSADEQSQKSSSPVHTNVFLPAYNGTGWDDGWDLLENGDDVLDSGTAHDVRTMIRLV